MRLCRLLLAVALLFGTVAGPAVEVAQACPMCKEANESDDRKPRAYMYSILFMLAVPATIFSGLGYGLYRMSRKEQMALEEDGTLKDHAQS